MKKTIVTMMVLLFAVGTAYAVDVELGGSYYAQGTYFDNVYGTTFADDNEVNFGMYEHELDLTTKFSVSDNTSVTANFEMRDETWPGSGAGVVAAMDANEEDNETFDFGATDNNIAVKLAMLSHKFGTGTKLDVGLMNLGDWGGISFGDNVEPFYAIKVTQDISMGCISFYTAKIDEEGADLAAAIDAEDEEDNDSDLYSLDAILKFGDSVVFAPRIQYLIDSAAVGQQNLVDANGNAIVDANGAQVVSGWDDSNNTFSIDLALTADLGMIGINSEIIYSSMSSDAITQNATTGLWGEADDVDLYGIFFDIFADINDQIRTGLWIAYGSVDEENNAVNGAFDFGDDFGSALIWGTEISDPLGVAGGNDLAGVTAFDIYADFKLLDNKLTISPAFLYFIDNYDIDGTELDGWEFDTEGAYKITDALTYSVGFGWADVDVEVANVDQNTGGALLLYHKLKLEF